jgi:hypothetical protein
LLPPKPQNPIWKEYNIDMINMHGSSVNFVGVKPWDVELRCEVLNLLGEGGDLGRLSESILEIFELLATTLLLDFFAHTD